MGVRGLARRVCLLRPGPGSPAPPHSPCGDTVCRPTRLRRSAFAREAAPSFAARAPAPFAIARARHCPLSSAAPRCRGSRLTFAALNTTPAAQPAVLHTRARNVRAWPDPARPRTPSPTRADPRGRRTLRASGSRPASSPTARTPPSAQNAHPPPPPVGVARPRTRPA